MPVALILCAVVLAGAALVLSFVGRDQEAQTALLFAILFVLIARD